MADPAAIAVGGVGFSPRLFAVGGLHTPLPRNPTRNTRAIAVQGIGFGRVLTALQGFSTDRFDDSDTQLYLPPRRRKQKRHDRDDDVLLFLLK